MFNYLRDKLAAVRLRARYQRLVQERVLQLIEGDSPQPVAEDPGQWMLLGGTKSPLDDAARTNARTQARRFVLDNPHARNVLRLLDIYVVGPGLAQHAKAAEGTVDAELLKRADRLWSEFLEANRRHFSLREHARRTWRDGECFLRKFTSNHWPPSVRFLDPECIGPTATDPDTAGILTDPADVETVLAYLRIDPGTGELLEEIPADELLHTKYGVDSNEKRGVTLFAPLLTMFTQFERWLEIELQARKLQASIVLWRKVHGSPSQATSFADAVKTDSGTDPSGPFRRERWRAGTILTTSQGTELQFLQPNTNFGDAVPLGRLMLLSLAAGAGLPEFMLTSDASNANYSSTMVAEGPAVKLFESEQHFFAGEFRQLWSWVMTEAVRHGLLPADLPPRIEPNWSFPLLVNRDRIRERLADVRLIETGVLSRAEVARRDGVDPAAMRAEIQGERGA